MAEEYDLNNLSGIHGLSDKEAQAKLAREGYNEIPSTKKRSIFSIALSIIREPMLLLLIASGILYMILGDIQEALMLLGFVFVIIGITLYQERKTERSLEALRDLSSPRALVIRDGESKRIAGREVVKGDIILLSEGDRIPADGITLAANNLTVEESLLTGESLPVQKSESSETTEMGRPGGENSPFVYSGTLVVGGMGIAQVAATGLATEFGKIGRSLQTIKPEETLLQKETRKIVRNLALIGLSMCVVMAIFYGVSRGTWIEGLLASITLAMAILPEEFPVVLTVFLALGAWRISKNQVLTRRMPAIETLGSNTVLCVDKTGTLTQNRMSVSKLYCQDEYCDLNTGEQTPPPEKFHPLIEYSILSSQTNPFDPMEKALKNLGVEFATLTEHLHNNWTFVKEYPLSKQLLSISRVWKSPVSNDHIIAAKGAPEAIMDLCHVDQNTIQHLSRQVEIMAGQGLRVLGVARARFQPASLPGDQHDFAFDFLGLVGFADPVRPTVPLAIKECYNAGIRVVMITGDYPVTAQQIGRQIGLRNVDNIVTGLEMDALNDEELSQRVKGVNIFARVVPEQKLRLVNAFKANGEIVSMTGDGVNDAPALKAANIGIAMGGRGTDVAREAGALVLLDDDFSSIVKAVGLGRRIFDNLRKAMAYILAVHVPIAGLSLIPVLLGLPLVLLPVHVVFLELIIDPACSIVFEAERAEPDVMRRPPRNRKEPLFSGRTISLSLLQGAAILLVTIVLYWWILNRGLGEAEARGMAFTTLVLANLGLILSNRFLSTNIISALRFRNNALYIIVASTLVLLALVLYVPVLRDLFRFAPLHPNDLLLCLGAGALCVIWFEVVKLATRRLRPTTSRG
jgi:P-type Ca2+ transporter type 2C